MRWGKFYTCLELTSLITTRGKLYGESAKQLAKQLCLDNPNDRPTIDTIMKHPLLHRTIKSERNKYSATKNYINLPPEIESVAIAIRNLANKLTYIDQLESDDPERHALLSLIKDQIQSLKEDVGKQFSSEKFGQPMQKLHQQLAEDLELIEQLEKPSNTPRISKI